MMSVLWLVPYGDNRGGGVVERNGSICANNLHKQSPNSTMSSLNMVNLMMGCWDKDMRSSMLSEMGQGKLMGSICCTQIPFILVTINQSHLSPLLKSYSVNPLIDPKTHFNTSIIELFFVMILTTPYAYKLMFYV